MQYDFVSFRIVIILNFSEFFGRTAGSTVYDDFDPSRGPTVSQCKVEIKLIVPSICTVDGTSYSPPLIFPLSLVF